MVVLAGQEPPLGLGFSQLSGGPPGASWRGFLEGERDSLEGELDFFWREGLEEQLSIQPHNQPLSAALCGGIDPKE